MKIFNQDIGSIQMHIEDAIKQLSKFKNPDKFMEVLYLVNGLNENIIYHSNIEIYRLNREKIDAAYGLFKQIVRYTKSTKREIKNAHNINKNYGMIFTTSSRILNGLDEKIEIDQSMLKKEEYTDQEMFSIIEKYYQNKLDFESIALLQYLATHGFIYDIDLGEEFAGLSMSSSTLNKSFILMPNHHNFNTIAVLIHELKHIKEWESINNLHHSLRYREGNNFLEVGPMYEEKQFLDHSSKDPTFKKQAINHHYLNYMKLQDQLKSIVQISSSSTESGILSVEDTIYLVNSICGNIFSDILLSADKNMRRQFFEMLRKRKNLFLDSFDFATVGLTNYGVADKVVKQYQKYK